jgi:hypothetical protein
LQKALITHEKTALNSQGIISDSTVLRVAESPHGSSSSECSNISTSKHSRASREQSFSESFKTDFSSIMNSSFDTNEENDLKRLKLENEKKALEIQERSIKLQEDTLKFQIAESQKNEASNRIRDELLRKLLSEKK